MAALPDVITVAQLDELPERGDAYYELHHGEVVEVSRAKKGHVDLQDRLAGLLRNLLSSFGRVLVECPYRALWEFEYRVADVAVISYYRWNATAPHEDLRGAPELVIEVKSPWTIAAPARFP